MNHLALLPNKMGMLKEKNDHLLAIKRAFLFQKKCF